MAQHITPYGLHANPQGKGNDEWNKYLNQARLAMTMDGQTALGLALGKAIRYFWDKHLAERHAKQDAAEARNAEIANGKISDVDAFRKANGNRQEPTLYVPENWRDNDVVKEALTPVVDNAGNVNPRYATTRPVPEGFTADTNMTGMYIDGNGNRQTYLNPDREKYNFMNRGWL